MLAGMHPTDSSIASQPSEAGPAVGPMTSSTPGCPYLTSTSRAWVASGPSNDHRCGAVAPAAALSTEKQRRLCLTANHAACATYLAAREARGTRASGQRDGIAGWGWVRTTPVVDGSVGIGASLVAIVAERRGWQVIPAIVLVAALAALGLSNIGASNHSPSATSSVVVAAGATRSASPGPVSTPLVSAPPSSVLPTLPQTPRPTSTPTTPPSATPVPSARTTYTVKSGDTLYGIANQFGVSWTALKTLNGLTSNALHIGQVLRIP